MWSLLGDVSASGLAYVRASSQHEAKDRGRYHALNLLDEDPNTVWCEGEEGLGEGQGITIYFKGKQRIDRIVLMPAASSGRIVQSVRVSDGSRSVVIPISENGIEQTIKPPLFGTTFDITIEAVAHKNPDSTLPADVACLADATLYWGKHLFGGRSDAEKLRFDARLDKLLGRWQGGALGAPEMFLVFALDGSWEWIYKPLLGGKNRRVTGEYRFRNNRLLMREGEAGRWADMQFNWQRIAIDKDDQGVPLSDYDKILLGKALGEELGGAYNNAQF